ncbi:unnamed protein product, partial [Symbiodinium sp. CCMP2456]
VPVKDASGTPASLAAPKKAALKSALKQVPSPADVQRKVDVAQSRRQLRRNSRVRAALRASTSSSDASDDEEPEHRDKRGRSVTTRYIRNTQREVLHEAARALRKAKHACLLYRRKFSPQPWPGNAADH